jgi:hypothetical protein
MPRAEQSAKMPGNRFVNLAPSRRAKNRAGDDVARRELSQCVHAAHEAHTARVHEDRAFAPHGF